MKKLFALIAVFGMLFMGASIFAQDETSSAQDAPQVAEEVGTQSSAAAEPAVTVVRVLLRPVCGAKEVDLPCCIPP